jgi:tRNA (guanine26-N2/guanine27-N2)-dimethyltransferase
LRYCDEIGTEGFRVLEALSATGLRAVRYAKELEGLDYVVANDIDPSAVQSIERNAKYNNVPEGLIRTQNLDAKFLLHKLHHDVSGKINHPETALHAVDLDPYGGTVTSFFLSHAHVHHRNLTSGPNLLQEPTLSWTVQSSSWQMEDYY